MADIRHSISVETDQAVRSLANLDGALKEHSGAVGDNAKAQKGLTGTSKALGASLAALTAVFVAGTAQAIELGDALGKMSERTGIAVEDLSSLKRIAENSDTSLQALASGLSKLSKGMLDAAEKGTGPVAEGLQRLGIAATTADGKLRSSEAVFADVSQAFSQMENGAEKAGLAMRLFGGAGEQLIPLLNQGADALAENARISRELGLVWADETSQAAEDFNDAIADLKRVADGFFNAAAQSYVPILADVAKGAVLAARAFLTLGAAQDDERKAAQDALNAQVDRIDALKAERDAEDEVFGLRDEATGALVFQTDKSKELTAEIERQIEVKKRLEKELGAEAGLLVGVTAELESYRQKVTEVNDTESALDKGRAERRAAEAARRDEEAAELDGRLEQETSLLDALNEADAERNERIFEFLERRKEEEAALTARIEAEEAARRQAQQDTLDAASAVADSMVALTEVVTAAAIEGANEQTRAGQDALLAAFVANKVAAVAQAGVNTALAISNAIANAPNPVVGAVLAIAAGIAGAAATASIVAQPAPTFHDGGAISDEVDIRAMAGEVVLSKPEVRALGGPDGVERVTAAARNGDGSGQVVVVQKLNHKVLDVQTSRAVKRTGSPLDSALRTNNPRSIGRRNPYGKRV